MPYKRSFVPSLNKLFLYTSRSSLKSHCYSEKEDNMFGKLVVQLPSKFKGGQLVVRHDGKAKFFDYSSNGPINNAMSTFFAAFNCDCDYKILPVTEGHRFCLVYNLIATDPELPLASQQSVLEMNLIALLQNWETSSKLVYVLTHKYSEANLSFKDLKSTDKSVAKILKRVSSACDLNIYLALLKKDDSSEADGVGDEDYDCSGCASTFDGEFDEISYTLKSLVADENNEKIDLSNTSSYLTVDFDNEVIPVDCLHSVMSYQQKSEHSGNVHLNKSYRCAAITFWPKKITFQVMKSSEAPQSLIDTFFLKESEKYFEDNCRNARQQDKVLLWTKSILTQRRYSASEVTKVAIVNTIIKFSDVELIRKSIFQGLASAPEAFAVILKECDKHGWEHFTDAMSAMFKQLTVNNAIQNLNLLLGDGNLNAEKKNLFSVLLNEIFVRGPTPITANVSSANKITKQNEEKELLEPLVNAILEFNDLPMMQKFVACILPLHSETISLLEMICERNSWELFATDVIEKFRKLSKKEKIVYLTSLVQNGILNDNKKNLCIELFSIIVEVNEESINNSLYSYKRTKSAAEIRKHRKYEKVILEQLVKTAMIFNDLQLLKNIFERIFQLHAETIPILTNLTKIYGWTAFAAEISSKLQKLSQIDAIDTLSLLIESENFKEEKTLCSDLFQVILSGNYSTPSHTISPLMTQEEKSSHLKDNDYILYSICRVTEKLNFDLMTFAKSKSFKDFVPVLLRLVQKDTNRLSSFWTAIANYFISEMDKELAKEIESSWRRNTHPFACCRDCISLNIFLRSDRVVASFKIGEQRRKHLVSRIILMEKLTHRTVSGERGSAVLVVNKTEMSGAEAMKERDLSRSLLEKLQSVMPGNV